MLEVNIISVFEVAALTIISHKHIGLIDLAYFVLAYEVTSSNVDMPNLVLKVMPRSIDLNANEFRL